MVKAVIKVKYQQELSFFKKYILKLPIIDRCDFYMDNNDIICCIKVKSNDVCFKMCILKDAYPKNVENLLSSSNYEGYHVILAPYVTINTEKIIKKYSAGYMDYSGNCYINIESIYIHITGQKNTNIKKRGQKSIFQRSSVVSSKILRVMFEDINKTWKLKELSEQVGCSIGQVSKVKDFLLKQAWISQSSEGIKIIEVEEILKSWASVYGCDSTLNEEYYSLENISDIEHKLQLLKDEKGIDYYLTCFSGGVRYQPVVRYNKIHCYIDPQSISDVIEYLNCKKVNNGGNIIFMVPYDECVLMNSKQINHSQVVSPIQIFLDCMNQKGRGEELANEVLLREIIKE